MAAPGDLDPTGRQVVAQGREETHAHKRLVVLVVGKQFGIVPEEDGHGPQPGRIDAGEASRAAHRQAKQHHDGDHGSQDRGGGHQSVHGLFLNDPT